MLTATSALVNAWSQLPNIIYNSKMIQNLVMVMMLLTFVHSCTKPHPYTELPSDGHHHRVAPLSVASVSSGALFRTTSRRFYAGEMFQCGVYSPDGDIVYHCCSSNDSNQRSCSFAITVRRHQGLKSIFVITI